MRGFNEGLRWFIIQLKLSTDQCSHWLARCLRADQMETSLWSISASRSFVDTKRAVRTLPAKAPTLDWGAKVPSLTRCVIWAGSGAWAAGPRTAAGGRWSPRCPAASDWDPSLSALLSWRVRTPWTSTYCTTKSQCISKTSGRQCMCNFLNIIKQIKDV